MSDQKHTPLQSAMASLKANPQYQVLAKELESLRLRCLDEIMDEGTTDARRKELVIRANDLRMFSELPDDLIEDEEINKNNS